MKLLEPLGFSVKEASSGEQALEIWREWRPQVIIMDLRMPGVDGLEAARRIKADDMGSGTKIIAVTAGGLSEDRTEALAAGCDDFLRKPFKTDKLLRIIEKYSGVSYAFEDDPPINQEKPADLGRDLTPEDLDGLPLSLVNELRHAVDRVDFDKTQQLIQRLESLNGPLAGTLRSMLEGYRFDRLQSWLENYPLPKEQQR